MTQSLRHLNTGNCAKCSEIFDRYPGFHRGLRDWFRAFQESTKDAHISCAGRGQIEQEEYFTNGTSKAHYGQSAHNFNGAIDIFRLTVNGASYDRPWFEHNVGQGVLRCNSSDSSGLELTWYGMPGSPYFELPHVEVKNWKELVASGVLKLVE